MIKRTGETKVYSGRIIDVLHRRVEVNNNQIIEYEIIHRPRVVNVIALISPGNFIMVHQYRASVGKYIWEFAGGSVEKEEKPVEAAMRELEEETGYRASKMESIGIFYTAPHFSDEIIHLFLATGLSKGIKEPQEKEILTVSTISEEKFLNEVINSEIMDAKTIVSYFIFKQIEAAKK